MRETVGLRVALCSRDRGSGDRHRRKMIVVKFISTVGAAVMHSSHHRHDQMCPLVRKATSCLTEPPLPACARADCHMNLTPQDIHGISRKSRRGRGAFQRRHSTMQKRFDDVRMSGHDRGKCVSGSKRQATSCDRFRARCDRHAS